MSRSAVDRLLAPLSRDQFVRRYWPDRFYVTHGRLTRLRGLYDLPEFHSIEAALKTKCSSVRAIGNSANGEPFTFAASSGQAAWLYRAALAVYMANVVSASPRLEQWIADLHTELRLPPKTISPRLLAAPAGGRVLPHFDASAGFIVQLKGRKIWRVARNEHLPDPPIDYWIGQPVPPELRRLAQNGLPDRLPDDAETIEMRPGSVLYLPRGWWHATQTVEDSLHLDFTMDIPTWEQRAAREIRERLQADERWRAPAVGRRPDTYRQLLSNIEELVLRGRRQS